MKKRQKKGNPEMSCWIHDGIGMQKCLRLDSSFCSKLYSAALITLHQYLVGIQYFLDLPGKTHHCLESSGTFMLPCIFSNCLISFDPYSEAFLSCFIDSILKTLLRDISASVHMLFQRLVKHIWKVLRLAFLLVRGCKVRLRAMKAPRHLRLNWVSCSQNSWWHLRTMELIVGNFFQEKTDTAPKK